MFQKIKNHIFGLGLIFAILLFVNNIALTKAIWVQSIDTIAGYSAIFKTSQLQPETDVDFLVTKSNGTQITLHSKSNIAGIAEAELFGYNTKKAGIYNVKVRQTGTNSYWSSTAFHVYPDILSSSQSQIKLNQTSASADGKKTVLITVQLYDRYRNPISGHQVKLISSRIEDKISLVSQSSTDTNGQIVFQVSSNYPGVSVYSALDINLGVTLNDRAKVIFFTPIQTQKNWWGNLLQADLLATDTLSDTNTTITAGPVHSFDIEILDSIPAGVAQNIKVIARDKDGNVAKDYTGTILFATPDDENSVLPADDGEFSFDPKDQGEFAFDLAITFTKLGTQTIQVFDKEDWDIQGEKKITVIDGEGSSSNPVPTWILQIKTPTDGAILSTPSFSLVGKGSATDLIKIFDNDLKIGETTVDADGIFTFDVKNLIDGTHAFYVKGLSDVSSTINFQLDSSPPTIDFFSITPEGTIPPSSNYTITIISEPHLDEVSIRLNSVLEKLTEKTDEPGTYQTTLVAPQVGWEYDIDAILIDNLGNKGEYLHKSLLRVSSPVPNLPPKVTGLRAISDDSKITLTWDLITDSIVPIQKYRIYYGNTPETLTQIVETNGVINSWYIPNLKNGQTYSFAVVGVDQKNQESIEKSLVVSAIPKVPYALLRAVASDSRVTLSWDAFGRNVTNYRIKYGLSSGNYSEYQDTFDNRTTWYIPDLINGVSYYFQVVPLDYNGFEQVGSPEASATPFGSGFKPVAGSQNFVLPQTHPPKAETWPEAWIVILASLFLVDILLRLRRKFFIH